MRVISFAAGGVCDLGGVAGEFWAATPSATTEHVAMQRQAKNFVSEVLPRRCSAVETAGYGYLTHQFGSCNFVKKLLAGKMGTL
jgi:hypothetical protein